MTSFCQTDLSIISFYTPLNYTVEISWPSDQDSRKAVEQALRAHYRAAVFGQFRGTYREAREYRKVHLHQEVLPDPYSIPELPRVITPEPWDESEECDWIYEGGRRIAPPGYEYMQRCIDEEWGKRHKPLF